VSRYQKDKTSLDFTEARDSEWQWHQLDHMQVCTSLQTDNYASTPPLCSFLCCEQDSPPSSLENLKSVDNEAATAAASPVDDSRDLQTTASHRQPLISTSPGTSNPSKPASRDRAVSGSAAAGPGSAAAAEADADADNTADDVPTTADVTTSLIGKASSHVSLDSYDRTKNPFFTD